MSTLRLSAYSHRAVYACSDRIHTHMPPHKSMLSVAYVPQPLIIRLGFVIGNLTASNSGTRDRIADECNGIAPLMAILGNYTEKRLKYAVSGAPPTAIGRGSTGSRPQSGSAVPSDGGTGESSSGRAGQSPPMGLTEVDDVLVKVVRALANLAINPSIGSRLAVTPGVGHLIDLFLAVPVADNEELVLNVVSCITNLSFYAAAPAMLHASDTELPEAYTAPSSEREGVVKGGRNVLIGRRMDISRRLMTILLHPNAEAVRVLGLACGHHRGSEGGGIHAIFPRVSIRLDCPSLQLTSPCWHE